jgi:hypothetical protein
VGIRPSLDKLANSANSSPWPRQLNGLDHLAIATLSSPNPSPIPRPKIIGLSSSQLLYSLPMLPRSNMNEAATHPVVAVPAYFNSAQRQATWDINAVVGYAPYINCEPAAIVYDLSGGSVDMALLSTARSSRDGILRWC